jgi:DNA-binding response OmpR family regulator
MSVPIPHDPELRVTSPLTVPALQQELLLVESEPMAAMHAPLLRREYRVLATSDVNVAMQYLSRANAPALVVADIDEHPEAAVGLCRAAKSLRTAATMLVTTSEPTAVPDVLEAGCDAVLLKPFANNLFYARIGRLMRTRGEQMRLRARHADVTADRSTRTEPLATTNRTWPETACPSCAHQRAVSFEFSSHRRSWYACLACKKVWIAKRQE